MRTSAPTELELAHVVVDGLEYFGAVVARFIRYHAHEIARCNHAQLDRVPIEVEIEIGFEPIVVDGRMVSGQSLTKGVRARGEDPVATCVSRAIRAITFPFMGNMTAAVSMTLRPRVVRTLGCPDRRDGSVPSAPELVGVPVHRPV